MSPADNTRASPQHTDPNLVEPFYSVQMPPPQRPAVLPRADSRTEPFFRTRTPFREPSLPPPQLRSASRRIASSIYSVPSSQAIDRIAFDAPAVPPLPAFHHQQQQGRRLSPVPIVEVVNADHEDECLESEARGFVTSQDSLGAKGLRRREPMRVLTRSGRLLCANPNTVPSRLRRRDRDEDLRRSLPAVWKAYKVPTTAVDDDKIVDRGELFRKGLMRVEARVTKYDPVSRFLHDDYRDVEMPQNAHEDGASFRSEWCVRRISDAERPIRPIRASPINGMAVERRSVERMRVERMSSERVPIEQIPDHHLFNPRTIVTPLQSHHHRAPAPQSGQPPPALRRPSLVRRLSTSVKKAILPHRRPSCVVDRAGERQPNISPPIIPRPKRPQRLSEASRGPAGSCEISRRALPLRQLPAPVPDTPTQLPPKPRVVGRGSRETCFSDFLRAGPSPPPLPLASAPWTLREQYSRPEFKPRPLCVAGVGVVGSSVFSGTGNDTVEDLIESYRHLGEGDGTYEFLREGKGEGEMMIDAYDRGSHASFFVRRRMV